MKQSFVRLILRTVLVFLLAGTVVVVSYVATRSWVDERAQEQGVFLAFELLGDIAPAARPTRLKELQPNFSFNLSLVPVDHVEAQIGRSTRPGEAIPHRVSWREEWYYLIFDEGENALAAGPVRPGVPEGATPVGAIVALVGLPFLAILVALSIERQLRKVERASVALAEGELGARVQNLGGPSRELAASFNAMADRIEQLVKSRDDLLQAVSHELGSPLARLRFHLELLENEPESKHADRHEALAKELDTLEELVSELLGYVQSERQKPKLERFEPRSVLVDLAELASLDAPADRTIEFTVDVAKGQQVVADQRLFQRAAENLIRNAVRYARSQVRIHCDSNGDKHWLSVEDDGPGIPNELREKVIVPFFRADASRPTHLGGVGLGLAIVKRIVDQHDGSLAFDTSSLGGAKVRIVWPNTPR